MYILHMNINIVYYSVLKSFGETFLIAVYLNVNTKNKPKNKSLLERI